MESAASPLRRARWPIFVLIAFAGLALRLPQLGVRPMHTDEAVNAYIVGHAW
jgi:predicted membrane-bound mannosyltransferase